MWAMEVDLPVSKMNQDGGSVGSAGCIFPSGANAIAISVPDCIVLKRPADTEGRGK